MHKAFTSILTALILFSCCAEEDSYILWRKNISGNVWIDTKGLGFPIYNNTVVFHSTPTSTDGHIHSVVYGLDTKTGKEKWRLTNEDFSPKKDLEFFNYKDYYQKENILVAGDYFSNDPQRESYIYAIDIDAGKVLWVKELPHLTEQGRMIRGSGNYAYMDARDSTHFMLYQIDITNGDYSVAFDYSPEDLPADQPMKKGLELHEFSDVYTNSAGDDFVACSFNCYDFETNRNKSYCTLYVYNLTQKKAVFQDYVNKESSDTVHDDFFGRICYHEGKLLVGKGEGVYCYDAFQNHQGPLWHRSVFVGDGVGFGSGNDEIMQMFAYQDHVLAFSVDHLNAYNIENGDSLYNVWISSNEARLIDGVIYQTNKGNFVMKDALTGKELKRIKTMDTSFQGDRPNGADGRIYIHTGTHAYCIKAWGE